jgi:hypothetical protein
MSDGLIEQGIKAILGRNPFLNLGGFILGYAVDTLLLGNIFHMSTVFYTHMREKWHITTIVVSQSGLKSTAQVDVNCCSYFAWCYRRRSLASIRTS